MAVTTTTNMPPATLEFYDKVLLKRALAVLCHDKVAQTRPLPLNSGLSLKFRRIESSSPALVPLSEITNPSPKTMTKTDITATPSTFGDYYEITEAVDLMSEDKIILEAVEENAEQAGNTLDQVWRNVFVGGTSVRYGGAVVGRSSIVTKVSAADLDVAIKSLHNNNAKYITDMIKPGSGYASTPVMPSYIAITHPEVIADLQSILGTSWKGVEYYAGGSAMANEVGSYKNIRFLMTTNAKKWPDLGGTAVTNTLKYTTANTACDVYSILIFGKDAVGIIPLGKKTIETIIKKKEEAGGPLELSSTVGWKARTTGKILNELHMYRIEIGVSA